MPRSIGPPVTMIAGTSALAAPISMAGVVLSQPERSTTPSKGRLRMHSSTSIDIRFRKSIVVGFMRGSESEITGNSRGNPPARQTPRLTCSATDLRCALQFVASLHEFAMPMTGRPWNASSETPSALIQARWRKPLRSVPPNQCWLRSRGVVTDARGPDVVGGSLRRRGSSEELAAERLPHLGREAEALHVHPLVVAVEHERVLGVRDARGVETEAVGRDALPAEETGVRRTHRQPRHDVAARN